MQKSIAVLDSISSVRARIKAMVEKLNVHVYEATNPVEFMNLMNYIQYKTELVLMDINFSDDTGFLLLKKIKEKNGKIPVLIMTSDNKRQTFIRGIVEGASDYILKPFDDKTVLERVVRYLSIGTGEKAPEKVSFGIHDYLNGEFKKAVKGKYCLTVSFSTYFKPAEEITIELEKEYLQYSDLIHNSLKAAVWETDIFEKYGSQTFLGSFPFCRPDNTSFIDKKLLESFSAIKSKYQGLNNFYLVNTFATIPENCNSVEEALNKLTEDMKLAISDFKRGLGLQV